VVTAYPTRKVVVVCVAFVLASVCLTLFVWRSVGGPIPLSAKTYEVRALFDNAGQLAPNADVRIAGVSVGKVAAIRPRGLRTEATLAIDPQYAPLSADVRAILRAKTLLGETFVALTQGSPDGPRLDDGEMIPARQIEDTQPLDRVLGTLDADGRERLRELLLDTGTVLDGRAQDLNDAAGNLATGTAQLDAVLRIVDEQGGAVSTLSRETGRVLQTVGDEDAAVRELVRSGRRALSATAARDERLEATVRATPPFLRELRRSSDAVSRTARLAGPTLRAFRPVAPRVAPTLTAIERATPDVEGLLRDMGGLTPVARRSLPAAASLVSALSPFMTQMEPTARQILPMIQYIAAYRRELVATTGNVSATLQGTSPGTDGRVRPYMRTIVPFGPETFTGASRRRPDNRHNAYMAPGGLAHLTDGLLAADCRTAGDSETPAPSCRQQPGWSFAGGREAYFQRLGERPLLPGALRRLGALAGFGG
jgi:phospholipid/cholesterol/gamma-HCH transport system substrate-binding protein